jgi:hypothetical protein
MMLEILLKAIEIEKNAPALDMTDPHIHSEIANAVVGLVKASLM